MIEFDTAVFDDEYEATSTKIMIKKRKPHSRKNMSARAMRVMLLKNML